MTQNNITDNEKFAARIAEQKVPPGYALVPIVTTRAMDDVMREPDWQWTDVLAAAESITEDDYLEPYLPKAAEKIAEKDARIEELEQQLEVARKVPDDLIDAVTLAMQKSWALGQTYWRQADSESFKQQDKSIETQDSFYALVDEIRTKLSGDAAIRQIGGAE